MKKLLPLLILIAACGNPSQPVNEKFAATLATSNITFADGFESFPFKSWPTVVGGVTQSSVHALEGNYSAFFNLSRGDKQIANGARSEMNLDPIPKVPAEQWIGLSYFIDSTWKPNFSGQTTITAQFHSAQGNPPVAFGINVNQWYVQYSVTRTGIISLGAVQKNAWTSVVFHTKWARDNTGLVEIYINGVKVNSQSGANFADATGGPFFKCGLYNWAWNASTQQDPNEEDGKADDQTIKNVHLWIDAVRVADATGSLAAVSPGGSATTTPPVTTPPVTTPPVTTAKPPTVSAGTDQTITTNKVTIEGKVTGSNLQYAWSEVSGPSPIIFTVQNPTTGITGLVSGEYTLKLTATDSISKLSAFDTVHVTVKMPVVTPPAVTITSISVTLGYLRSDGTTGVISGVTSYSFVKGVLTVNGKVVK